MTDPTPSASMRARLRESPAVAAPQREPTADAIDAQELRFYRQYGFPYVDWEHAFDEPRVGMYAIKLPLSWPHPEGEGTCAAIILHAFTVEQLYIKAFQHIESLGPNPGAPAAARGQYGTRAGSEIILCLFARRALQALDSPKSAKRLAIPLQNLYRLLEMRRYSAWFDGEPRDWERRIRPLIERLVPDIAVIDRLESSLRSLDINRSPSPEAEQELRAFLDGIVAELGAAEQPTDTGEEQ